MSNIETVWELLQWYPRDYNEYQPAFAEWRDAGTIQGVGTVTSKYAGRRCVLSIAVHLNPPAPLDDGGWGSDDGSSAAPDAGAHFTLIMDSQNVCADAGAMQTRYSK